MSNTKVLSQEEISRFYKLIEEACEICGWDMAFEESGDELQGMIIGRMDYIRGVVNAIEESSGELAEFEVITDIDDEDKIIH